MDYTALYQPIPLSNGTLLALLVLAIPLLNFIWLIFLSGKKVELLGWVASGFMLGSMLAAALIFRWVWGGEPLHSRTIWFEIPVAAFSYPFTVGIHIDRIAALMLVVVTLISWLVHVFSIRYMEHDEKYARYFALLGLFTFSMLGIVVMDNLLLIFFFWELVGVSSYSLIGFWHRRPAAIQASTKAFLMNRVGDVGFIISLLVLWSQFGTLDLQILEQLMQQSVFTEEGVWLSYFRVNNLLIENAAPVGWLTVAGLGLMLGAIGKSAQFPLFTWLPDAMEGPTPVSALLHAATMVAAGVYLLLRVFVLLDTTTLTTIAIIGSSTALIAAISALMQHDIKKVLAYSTVSQLGYMMLGVGTGAYQAAFFHLVAHASFKAGLFLSAGAIIHSMSHLKEHMLQADNFNAQDMRWMGGLRTRIPIVFVVYIVASAALIGIPFFSGFLSKDAILNGALSWAAYQSSGGISWHWIIPTLAFTTTLLTALYMGRQVLLVFFGKLRAKEPSVAIKWQPSWVMRVPLILLAILSLGLVYSLNPFSADESWLLQNLVTKLPAVPGDTLDYFEIRTIYPDWHQVTTWVALGASLLGLVVAYSLYRPQQARHQLYHQQPNYRSRLTAVFAQSWYLDRLYQLLFIRSTLLMGRAGQWIDRRIIDGLLHSLATAGVILAHIIAWLDQVLIDGLVRAGASIIQGLGALTRSVQTGRIQTYLVASLLLFIMLMYWLTQF
ncbi:NADH-quinone oxidoreductase subunit 5 family protein [Tunicatimonas pelagia]|uniref:NADH-quinone oxidoreductase subunit 5 family protein n=1 Tax=Tunicatimonas pelagia TaxID=931531 RepID=UPI002664F21B|nr:NADH-quinone oxidoreductase subunit L [Tunicatimonas pelagia]WKN40451.1 NADH-quinone oxidoreductase subunit L [Tunicatimonas pelagia]